VRVQGRQEEQTLQATDQALTLGEQVTETIRQWIVRGSIEPGQRLTEEWLAQQCQVSRVPVREALRRLQTEGFVVHTRHLGAVVARLSREDASGLLRLREVVERFVVAEAASSTAAERLDELGTIVRQAEDAMDREDWDALPKLNSRFHVAIARASANRSAIEVLSLLGHKIEWVYGLHVSRRAQDRGAWVEHAEILEALRDHDPELAVERISTHIGRAREGFDES